MIFIDFHLIFCQQDSFHLHENRQGSLPSQQLHWDPFGFQHFHRQPVVQQLPLAAGRVKLKGMNMKKGREMERNGNELNELMIFTLSNYVQGKIGLCWLCWLCYKLKAILSILHEVESVRNFVAHVASAIGVFTLRWTCHLPKQVEKVANWCQLKHVEQTANKPGQDRSNMIQYQGHI